VWLRYGGSQNIDEMTLGIENVHGGTARNVQLDEMTDGKLMSDKSENVPLLTVGQRQWLRLNVRTADDEFNWGPFKIDALLVKAERPIRATVQHEDANGSKYKTVFEITPDTNAWSVHIQQIERRRC
jgi:hypothetical protein